MNDKSLAIGSTIAAFVASLCCLGPLVVGGAGLGAALIATFAPLRPYFLALSALLLGGGFYFVYRKPKSASACEGAVCVPQSRSRRMAKPLLWVATLAVAALAFFPSYGSKLVRKPLEAAPAPAVALKTAELKIAGMYCDVCASVIERKISETPGVVHAEVRYPAGSAKVQYDSTKIAPAQLIEAVGATGYKASLSRSAGR